MSIRDEIKQWVKDILGNHFCEELGEGADDDIANEIVDHTPISKLLKLLEEAECPECAGRGYVEEDRGRTAWGSFGCKACNGTGKRYDIALIDKKAGLPDSPEYPKRKLLSLVAIKYYHKGIATLVKAGFEKVIKVMEV